MTNDITVFANNQFGSVRAFEVQSAPWFVAADVCQCLDLTNPSVTIARLDDDERAKFNLGRQGDGWAVNEFGLYNLILASRKPEAKQFKRWITHEVIPAIRQDGGYIQTRPDDTDADIMAKALLIAKSTIDRQKNQIESMRPKEIFADAVSVSHTDILVGDLAKLINQNGIEIGANRLFQWLRDKGYLIKRQGTDYNMPTQTSMDLGLFRVKETAITHGDGHVSVSKTPKVTGKGQVYFVNKFLAIKG